MFNFYVQCSMHSRTGSSALDRSAVQHGLSRAQPTSAKEKQYSLVTPPVVELIRPMRYGERDSERWHWQSGNLRVCGRGKRVCTAGMARRGGR